MNASAATLIVCGTGRMGRMVYQAAPDCGFQVSQLFSRTRPEWAGDTDWSDSEEGLRQASLMIEFSLPDGLLMAAEACSRIGIPLVTGTTGLDQEHRDALSEAAKHVPVLWAANFSPGLNLTLDLVRLASLESPADTNVSITDVHHVHKLDAPSGTAIKLAQAAGTALENINSIREGEVVGEHSLLFEMDGESIEITHRAGRRDVFARGALHAGQWLRFQPPGLYSVDDWLASRKQG